jgi:hypothetical protein
MEIMLKSVSHLYHKAFTLLEVVIAVTIFVAFSASATLAILQSNTAKIQANLNTIASNDINTLLQQIAADPPSSLIADTFTVPQACPAISDTNLGTAGVSCIQVGLATYQVSYSRSITQGSANTVLSLSFTGSLTLSDGVTVSQSLSITPPLNTNSYLVGVHLSGNISGFREPIYAVCLSNSLNALGSAVPDSSGTAIIPLSGLCPNPTTPIGLALNTTSSPYNEINGYVLSGPGVTQGVSAFSRVNSEVWTTAQINHTSTATLNIVANAQNPLSFIGSIAGTGTSGNTANNAPAFGNALGEPMGIVYDGQGNMYFADAKTNTIDEINANGILTQIVGEGVAGTPPSAAPGPPGTTTSAANAILEDPTYLAINSSTLYISNTGTCQVYALNLSNLNIVIAAGTGVCGYSGDGGLATSALLNGNQGLALTSSDLYIADTKNNVIRDVSLSTGDISTYAGTGTAGYSGNGGPASLAALNHPTGLATSGTVLYVSDTNNCVVRRVLIPQGSTTTTIQLVAGNHTCGYTGDNSPAGTAELNYPTGLTMSPTGSLYVADTENHVIRQINTNDTITTIAGTGTAGDSGTGGPSTQATFASPAGLAVGNLGAIYVADSASATIRTINSTDSSGPHGGSLCVWGTFLAPNPTSTPFCNSQASPSTISLQSYYLSPLDPNANLLQVALPPTAQITLTADDPNNTCPANGPGGFSDSGTAQNWNSGVVCSSWTWGPPQLFGPVGSTATSFSSASVTLSPGTTSAYNLIYSGSQDYPATAGYGAWSLPRLAQNCAQDSTCQPASPIDIPETEYCPTLQPSCLSAPVSPIKLIAPVTGPLGVSTVAVSGTTTFTVGIFDPNKAITSVSLENAPNDGSLTVVGGASSLSSGSTLPAPNGTNLTYYIFTYTPSTTVPLDTFTLSATDGSVTNDLSIGLYTGNYSWEIVSSLNNPPLAQGNGSIPITVTDIGTNGSPISATSAAPVVLTPSGPAGLTFSPTSATPNSLGEATFNVSAPTAQSGSIQFTIATSSPPNDSGISSTIPLTITPTPAYLTLSTSTPLRQGVTSTLTVSATDDAGSSVSLNNLPVSFSVSPSTAEISLSSSSCTLVAGTCSITVTPSISAPATSATIIAALNGLTTQLTQTVLSTYNVISASVSSFGIGQSQGLVLTVTNSDGQAATGGTLTIGTLPPGVTASPTSGTLNSLGQLQITITTTSSATVGNYSIPTTYVDTTNNSTSPSFSIHIASYSANIVFSTPTISIQQGSSASTDISVLGANSSPLSNVTVNLTDPTGIETPSSVNTASTGVVAINIAVPLTTPAGFYSITATTTAPNGATYSAQLSINVLQTTMAIELSSAIPPNTNYPSTLTVLDGAGNPVPNIAISSLTTSSNLISVSPTSGTTNTYGQIPLIFTSGSISIVGNYTLTAIIGGTPYTVGIEVN